MSINNELNKCVYEGSDMAFAESILTLFEEALDKVLIFAFDLKLFFIN